MPTIAELIGRGTAERLAAVRAQAGQCQAEAKTAPVQAATCQSCGQRLPAPAAVFRSGAEHQAADSGAGADVDPSRARA